MLVFTESAPEANHARRPSFVRNDDAERVEFTVARERAKQGDLRSALVTPILALRPIQDHGAIAPPRQPFFFDIALPIRAV